jgi:hypothetical protein
MTSDQQWDRLLERDALGEPLNEQERSMLAQRVERDPVYRVELDLLRALAEPAALRDDVRERAAAERALAALRRPAAPPAPSGGSVVHLRRWIAGGALAAAAAAALGVGLSRSAGDLPRADLPLAVSFVKTAGAIVIDGRPAEAPLSAPAGSQVELLQGTACLRPAPSVFVCLGEDTRIQLTDVESPRRRIDVLSGRVVVALDPQPPGSRLSVVARGVWSTAVGTMFSVEVNEDGVVQTAVYEGKVLVGGEDDGSLIEAHKIGLATGGQVQTDAVRGPDESNEWKALEEVSGKRYTPPPADEPGEPEAGAARDTSKVLEEVPLPTRAEPGRTPRPQRAEVPTEPEAAVAERSASEILDDARRLRTASRWTEAAAAYRELLQRHPASGEANAVLVSLGELELDRLGEPGLALGRFEQYLNLPGGSLAQEAKLGRIRALRALGRAGEEATAIDAFLAEYPGSLDAPALRARRARLGTP